VSWGDADQSGPLLIKTQSLAKLCVPCVLKLLVGPCWPSVRALVPAFQLAERVEKSRKEASHPAISLCVCVCVCVFVCVCVYLLVVSCLDVTVQYVELWVQ